MKKKNQQIDRAFDRVVFENNDEASSLDRSQEVSLILRRETYYRVTMRFEESGSSWKGDRRGPALV